MPEPAIRACTSADLPEVVAIVEARRKELAEYEPLMWRRAEGTAGPTREFFTTLIDEPGTVFLVAGALHAIEGFLIARIVPVPPVYDPGKTAVIDDFWVRSDDLWAGTGSRLLEAARVRLRADGASQIIVVAPAGNSHKLALLARSGLSMASTWWAAPA